MFGEQRPELACIEMVAVIERARKSRHGTLARRQVAIANRDLRRDGPGKGSRLPLLRGPGGKDARHRRGSGRGEGMIIAVIGRPIHPAIEPRSLLERRIAGAEETGFVDPDRGERLAQCRPAAFTDADGRDIGRLDECHVELGPSGRKQAGGQPASRPAAHDHQPVELGTHRSDVHTLSSRRIQNEPHCAGSAARLPEYRPDLRVRIAVTR